MIPLPYKRQFSTAKPPVELKYNFWLQPVVKWFATGVELEHDIGKSEKWHGGAA
jgi:hypothetical protein